MNSKSLLLALLLLATLSAYVGGARAAGPGVVFSQNGHTYEMVSVAGGITWPAARAAAAARTWNGQPGHLATLTTADEAAWVASTFPQAVSDEWWLGGWQPVNGGDPGAAWAWVTGEPWAYTNWNTFEPNNAAGVENCLLFARNGQWNDASDIHLAGGYVVEYGQGTEPPGTVSFLPPVNYPLASPRHLSTADFDGDGYSDIVAVTGGSSAIFYGKWDGTFEEAVLHSMGPDTILSDWAHVIGVDVNLDRRPDLVQVHGGAHHLAVRFNQGSRGFSEPVFYPTGQQPAGVTAADFNRDLFPDLAVSNHYGNNMGVYLNRGDGTFLPPQYYGGGSLPGRITSADYNLDGNPDIAMVHYLPGQVRIYLGNGQGGFVNGDTYGVGSHAAEIQTADFNGDRKPDLAVANTFAHNVSVFLGNGRGNFTGGTYSADGYPHLMGTGDLDGDGDVDLAVPTYQNHSLTVLVNARDGVMAPPLRFRSGGTNTRAATVADFNLDGRPDVAISNQDTNNISVFLNDTHFPRPPGPTNLRATRVDENRVELAWTDNSLTEDSFRIERKQGDGEFRATFAEIPDSTTHADITVNAGTTYTYRVVAARRTGDSPPSNEVTVSTPGLPVLAPSGLAATVASSTRIDLSWTDNSGNETAFEIEVKQGTGGWTVAGAVGEDVRAFEATDLIPSTTYSFRVRATNGGSESDYSNTVDATTHPAPPTAPSDLVAQVVSRTEVRLTWTDRSGNETGFELERSPGDANFTRIAALGAGATTHTDNGVSAGGTYHYRVRALNQGGPSTYSGIAVAETPPDPPGIPADLTARVVDPGTVELAWTDASTNETGFKIERAAAGGLFIPLETVRAGAVTYQDRGVALDTVYSYRLRATNTGGDSDWAGPVSVTTPPTAPGSLTAAVLNASTIQVTWHDTSFTETGFRLERKTGSGAFEPLESTGANTSSYNDRGLTPGTVYTYRLRAFNSGGESALSNEASATIPLAPALTPPSGLAAAAVGPNQVRLTWNDSSDREAGFEVERRSGSDLFTRISTVGANVTQYGDTSVAPSTAYEYRVRAVAGAEASGYSNLAGATTPPNPPAAPTGLGVEVVSATALRLTWTDASDNESGFELFRSTDGGGSFTRLGSTGAGETRYEDGELAAATTYHYRVRAFNAGGASTYTETAAGTTLPNPPAAPAGLRVELVPGSRTALRLTWSDVAGETGYEVERSPDGTAFTQVATPGADVTTLDDENLAPATTYSYRVRARNAGGFSPYSGVERGTTPGVPPDAPTGLMATVTPEGTVALAWTDASANETGFRIERRRGEEPFARLETVGVGVTTFTDRGVEAGYTYTYRVCATGAAGDSGFSNEASATIAGPVPAVALASVAVQPRRLQAGQTATVAVTLSGPAPAGGTVVALTWRNGTALTSAPASITVAAGATTGSFQVTARSLRRTVAVTLTAKLNGVRKRAQLTVQRRRGRR